MGISQGQHLEYLWWPEAVLSGWFLEEPPWLVSWSTRPKIEFMADLQFLDGSINYFLWLIVLTDSSHRDGSFKSSHILLIDDQFPGSLFCSGPQYSSVFDARNRDIHDHKPLPLGPVRCISPYAGFGTSSSPGSVDDLTCWISTKRSKLEDPKSMGFNFNVSIKWSHDLDDLGDPDDKTETSIYQIPFLVGALWFFWFWADHISFDFIHPDSWWIPCNL